MTSSGEAGGKPSAAEIAEAAKARASSQGSVEEDTRPRPSGPPITEESVHAIMSAVEREGRWEAADEIYVRAICGAVKLDFTQAELPVTGMVDLDVRTVCGSVEIIVPDGADVVLDGTPILGSVERKLPKKSRAPSPPADPDDDPPSFHIVGQAIMGSIEVIGR